MPDPKPKASKSQATPKPRRPKPHRQPLTPEELEGFREHRRLSKMGLPYLYMRTATGELLPWVASQADVLASDWAITFPVL